MIWNSVVLCTLWKWVLNRFRLLGIFIIHILFTTLFKEMGPTDTHGETAEDAPTKKKKFLQDCWGSHTKESVVSKNNKPYLLSYSRTYNQVTVRWQLGGPAWLVEGTSETLPTSLKTGEEVLMHPGYVFSLWEGVQHRGECDDLPSLVPQARKCWQASVSFQKPVKWSFLHCLDIFSFGDIVLEY